MIITFLWRYINSAVPRFTGKAPITRKTAKIRETPKNNRERFIGALAKTFIDYKYILKKCMLFIICYIYFFNCAFRYNEHYRKRTLQNKKLKSLFQNYNFTYFSKHLEYESHTISLNDKYFQLLAD